MLSVSCADIEPEGLTPVSEGDFADPALVPMVHQTLGDYMSLDEHNRESITELYLFRVGASDISGIEIFTNVIYLHLEENQIHDITPLSGMPRLYTVYLRDNQITELTPLATLTHIRMLDLSQNPISDVSPLKTLTNLRMLDLQDTDVSTGLAELVTLTNLKYLDLSDCWNIKESDFRILEEALDGCEIKEPESFAPEDDEQEE